MLKLQFKLQTIQMIQFSLRPKLYILFICIGPPLWSNGQSFWLQIQRPLVRFPALLDVPKTSGSGTGEAPVYKTENTAVGIRYADHATPSIRKSWH
jgi:hypothetical protein